MVQFVFSIMGLFTICHQDENNENKHRKNKQGKGKKKEEEKKTTTKTKTTNNSTNEGPMKGPKNKIKTTTNFNAN